jgi:hypothetical protein
MKPASGNGAPPGGKGLAIKPLKIGGRCPLGSAGGNGWETQARDLSARFLEGKGGLGRLVTPAPAARKKIRASSGRPLPANLRGRLEKQFGADLAAVRVHSGSQAAAAARAERADAFASGRDIYFRDGMFRPESVAGLRLLVHEITHVLQQTGRENSAGRLEARDIIASGETQRADWQQYPRAVPSSVKLDDLAAGYRSQVLTSDRPKFDALVQDLKKTVGEDLNETNANGSKLADRVMVNAEWDDVKIKVPFRALVCDVLRALRRNEAAAHLVILDPTLPCTLMSKEVAKLASEADHDHALGIHLAHDPLKKYFPWQFVDTFRRYLFGPTRPIQSLYAPGDKLGEFEKLADKIWDDLKAANQPGENETFIDSVNDLRFGDDMRLKAMSRLEGLYQKQFSEGDPLRKRQWIALTIARAFTKLQGKGGPILDLAMNEIIAVSERAAAFWDSVFLTLDARSIEKLRQFSDREDGQKTHKALLDAANLVFHRERGVIPPSKQFNENIARAKALLAKFSWNEVEQKLIALSRKDKWDPLLARWYGIQLKAVNDIEAVLGQYKYSEDRAFPGGKADVRVATRIRLARELDKFALTFGWRDLGSRAEAVASGTEPDQAENEVALIGDWHIDREAVIRDLASEEKGFTWNRPILGFGALTTGNLANLFLIEYYNRVSAEIQNILERNKEEGDYTQWRPPVFARALEAMTDFRLPRRHVIPAGEYELGIAPGTGEPGAPANAGQRTSFSSLITDHPKTRSYLNAIGAGFEVSATKDMSIFQAKLPKSGEPLFFWTIPPLEPLVRRLKPVRISIGKAEVSLDELVQKELTRAAAAKTERGASDSSTQPSAAEQGWIEWLKAFMCISESFTVEQGDLIDASLKQAYAEANERRVGFMRRAGAQDRRILIQLRVRPMLESYDGTFSTYSLPSDALRMIEVFLYGVLPRDEHDFHESAVVLELFRAGSGDVDLVGVFSKKIRRFELIVGWQAILRRAVRVVGKDRAAVRNVLTQEELRNDKWIEETVPRIQEAIDAMEKRKAESQLEFGFLGRKSSRERTYTTADYILGPVANDVLLDKKFIDVPDNLVDSSSGDRILAGKEFTIDGVTWKLAQVKLEFEYHPDWGNPFDEDTYRPSQLTVEGKPSEVDPKTHRRPTNRELLVVFRDRVELHVHENDDQILRELSHAVGMEVIIVGLEELEAFIEKSMEVMLDAAEFIPGAGQALMAARLVTSLIAFLGSEEFNEIKDKILDDPSGFIKDIGNLIGGELFRPERVINWLLLGELVPPQLSALKAKPKKQPPRTSKPSSALGKFAALIAKLVRAAEGLYHSFDGVRRRAGQAYLGIESFVHIHPALLLAFAFVADHIEDIRAAYNAVSDAEERNEAFLSVDGFGKTIGGIIEAINEIEIPREIVAMDMILSLILDLVIDRLGSKYKVAGKAILYVLDQLGYRQEIMRALAKEVPDSINPNHYWADFVGDALEPMFDNFRTEAVAGISHGLENFGFPRIDPDTAGKVKLAPSGTDFPEAAPMLSEDPDPLIGDFPVTSPGSGVPLSDPILHSYQDQFGHDFHHVRLHTGEQARLVTSRYQADALTTGSHVFLKPGLDPRDGRGAHVFRHELGHVLQQTGARPLGESHPRHAVLGQPQQGLQYDPSAEVAADRIAAAAEHRSGGAPLPIEAQDQYGLQPQISLTAVSRVLRRLSRSEAMTRHYEKLAQGQSAKPPLASLPQDLAHQIGNVGTDLLACFSSIDRFKMPEPFKGKWTEISDYIKGRLTRDKLSAEVERVALESLNEVRVPGADENAPKKWRINKRTFHVALEGMLYANGVACGIVWDAESIKGDAPVFHIARLEMAALNMVEIGGGSQLWTDLMKNSFNVDKGSDEKNRLQPRVRTYLQARGPVWGLWKKTSFALSDRVIEEIKNVIAKTGETLKAEDLPLPEVYLSPTAMGARPATGHIGLLVGTYQSQTGNNKSVERESHHTTQFLLLEYFRNWHESFQPFRHTLSIYPGLVTSGNKPAQFRPRSGPAIDIAGLTGEDEWARGPHMPAISLARVTHRRGDVHIEGEPDDLVDTAPRKRTQAGAVSNHFRDNITDPALRQAMFVAADETPLRAIVAARRDFVQEQIHSAMQATYQWMRDDMRDRLITGLESEEVNYYNNLATPPGDNAPPATKRLSAGQMGPVADKAAANNKSVMETSAHWS